MNCCGLESKKFKQNNTSDSAPVPTEPKSGAGVAKSNLILGLALVLVAGMFIGYFIKPPAFSENHLAAIKNESAAEQRTDFIALANNIKAEMSKQGKYNCCIEKPCTYCIEKTPGHGEGAACECMDNILAGRHPCGECIGEILEGHGEKKLVPFFAKAIAHKIGFRHEAHLQEIINDIYQ